MDKSPAAPAAGPLPMPDAIVSAEAMERMDMYPTHRSGDYLLRPGKPFPFGTSLVRGAVNFSIFSRRATSCTLILFDRHSRDPLAEIPFPDEFRIGNVWCMIVFGLDYEDLKYGYRMDGPWDPKDGLRFDKTKILLDPYSKLVSGRDVWGQPPDWSDPYQHRALVAYDDFDWQGDSPLDIPSQNLVIYEMHVRSFTRHPTSGVKKPGTYSAIRDKILHLKELGVNCVELMPVFEFDEFENSRVNPATGEQLYNYWGYSTVSFFAPKAGYASTGKLGMQVDELKNLIKELHQSGIAVILDVVFNHTAEGNELGPTISFRGLDNETYYMLTPDGFYYNFSGCGNTLNCNNPIVRDMVIDCLRYWAAEYHVDGFRFDLAAVLGRDPDGAPLANPPLLESLAFDPILGRCKLIAEAWDAGGLYQVGSFPSYNRWAEWNGKYRDALRKFLKGDAGLVGEMALRLTGSPDFYSSRGTGASINFVTCHDGFTLCDLVSYNQKHNEANGEGNTDGSNDNNSWNCGQEGPSDDPAINALRSRQMKNAIAMLLVSQGVPMLLMGDEVARTQRGNNNTYCHDSELNWLDWSLLDSNGDLLRFVSRCIAFRQAHPALRRPVHFANRDDLNTGYADVTWHGTQAWNTDWSAESRILAFMLNGRYAPGGSDDFIYVAMNMHWEAHDFELPRLPPGLAWHVFANTGAAVPEDSWTPGQEPPLSDQVHFFMGPRSVAILVGR